MKVWVLGQSPAKGYEDKPAIMNGCRTGKTWAKWCESLEIDPDYCEYFNSRNADGELCDIFWDRVVKEKEHPIIFVLGEIAALDLKRSGYWNPRIIKLPHPSGRNLKLNHPEFVARELFQAKVKFQSFFEAGEESEQAKSND